MVKVLKSVGKGLAGIAAAGAIWVGVDAGCYGWAKYHDYMADRYEGKSAVEFQSSTEDAEASLVYLTAFTMYSFQAAWAEVNGDADKAKGLYALAKESETLAEKHAEESDNHYKLYEEFKDDAWLHDSRSEDWEEFAKDIDPREVYKKLVNQ